MSNLIPFDTGNVPAKQLAALFGTQNDLVGNSAGGGFPVVSIKGKVFHIQRGDERTLITKPGEDDPAGSLEVVIVKANPGRSKVFYAAGYQEGSSGKPDCYSNNGVTPEADAQSPQAKTCATCAHNQWGSSVTGQGKKGKACSDSRRIAIATVGAPNDPMLVRVPAGSIKNLEEYGKILASRGVPPQAVVTRIGFDYSVAWPALTFKPVGLINDPELLKEIAAASQTELAAQIAGMKAVAPDTPIPDEDNASAAEAAPVVAQAPTPAQAPKAAAPKPAPAPTPAPAPVVQSAPSPTAGLESEISNMLDGMNFDD